MGEVGFDSSPPPPPQRLSWNNKTFVSTRFSVSAGLLALLLQLCRYYQDSQHHHPVGVAGVLRYWPAYLCRRAFAIFASFCFPREESEA